MKEKIINLFRQQKPVKYSRVKNCKNLGKELKLDGHMPKQFARVSWEEVLDFEKELIENPNNTYISYVNNMIKLGLIPEEVAVLLKDYDACIGVNYENTTCKLLNYFGVPTVYTFQYIAYEKPFSASIYCASQDEELINLRNETGSTFFNVEEINEVFDMIKGRYNLKGAKYAKFRNDFIRTILVRVVILGDIDFKFENIGILHNKSTGEIRLVNYDFEYMFGTSSWDVELREYVAEIVAKRFPKIFQDVCNRLQEIIKYRNDILMSDLLPKEKECFEHFLLSTYVFEEICEKLNLVK